MIAERVSAGELTGTELAGRAGFQQAHISNFLNRRRGLSVEAMDRLMVALRLEVRDLLPRESAAIAESGEPPSERIPVVEPAALLQSDFGSGDILEYRSFQKSFLRRIRAEIEGRRESWRRFVLIRADKESAQAMRPRLRTGALLLIDRHYPSLQRYWQREQNLYAVRSDGDWKVRYVELHDGQLTLRPEDPQSALDYIALGRGESGADYIAGRVAHICFEV